MKKTNKTMTAVLAALLLCGGTTSCQKTDEVPPVADKQATGYRLPDPEPLTEEDRAVINQQEQEYENNVDQ